MKHVVIGTAGHIDHGKTALVKRLTGRDTDTLKEEKERGISINLGFTFFDLPSGKRAGIVDVPGHEKFIKNMLAGASGIDLVLMIVAADEGVMPQTREHLEILKLLDIKKGIIVITKIDLVDSEMLSMVDEEVRKEFSGSLLEETQIVHVSSKTGEGIDKLVEFIDAAVEEVHEKDKEGIFRLPVDRVFSVSGFGTIATGTIISGTVKLGDSLQVYPGNTLCRVRGLQVHEKNVEMAEAGERCAINLSGVKAEEIERGSTLSPAGVMEPSTIIDCRLNYIKAADKPLLNRQRVRIYHGTEELFGRVVLLNSEELAPGQEGYAQIIIEKPIAAVSGDKFILRSYSPMTTIGGGTIINPNSRKKKRFDKAVIEDLAQRSLGNLEDILERNIETLSSSFPDLAVISKSAGKSEEAVKPYLEQLVKAGRVEELELSGRKNYLHINFVEKTLHKAKEILKEFHQKNPLRQGMGKEELKNRIFEAAIKQRQFDGFLAMMESGKKLKTHGSLVSLYDFSIVYDKASASIADRILEQYKNAGFMALKYEDIIKNEKDRIAFQRVYESLLQAGRLIKLSEDTVITAEVFEKGKALVETYTSEHGSITAGEARDLLGTSRKHAISFMEYLDQIKFTRRLGDKRVLFR